MENKLDVDGDANNAGDRCKGECGMQEDFVVPFDSSLRRKQEGKEWWCEFSRSGWVCEEIYDREADRGVC